MKLKLALTLGLLSPVFAFAQTYCASNATSTAGPQITNVTFAGINNTTGGCTTYNYYSATPGTMSPGGSYTFSVTTGVGCSSDINSQMGCYIDWNFDGDFADAGEIVFTRGAFAPSNGVYTTTINCPAANALGKARMRIVLRESGATAACNTYAWGETEDYDLNIVCTATNGISISRQFSSCDDSPEQLTATGMGSGVTLQWQTSTNQQTWANASSANPYTTTPITQITYYRLVAANSICSAPISTVFVKFPLSLAKNIDSICPGGTATLTATAPGTQTFTSNRTFTIPDPGNITSSMSILNAMPAVFGTGTIKNVCFTINHTYLSDLTVALVDPSGATLNLVNGRGGTGDNYANVCFVPGTGTPVPAANASNITGNYTAQQGDLAAFVNGKNINANWGLRATDAAAPDGGSIISWSITLNAPTVAWTPTTGLGTPNAATTSASPSVTTTYTATATFPGSTASDCKPTESLTLYVKPVYSPSISGTTTICHGQTTTLTATITPATPGIITYNWYTAPSGGTLLGTGASYTTPTLTSTTGTSTTTTYYAEAIYNGCSGVRTPVTVTTMTLPAAPTGAGIETCHNTTGTVSASSTTAGSTISWYDASTGGTLLQATSASYTTPTLSAPGPGTSTYTYYAESTISPGCNSATRGAVTVTVNPLPAEPTFASPAASVCANTSATITPTGPAGVTFKWYTYNLTSTGALLTTGPTYTTPTLSNTSTTADATISYHATATDAKGCVSATRGKAYVTIKALPAVPATTTAVFTCENTAKSISAVNSTGDQIDWWDASTGGTNLITNSTYTTPSLAAAPPTHTYSYYASAFRNGCYSASRAKQDVTVIIRPVLADPADKALCSNNSVAQLFSASPSAAATLNWTSIPGSGIGFASGTGTGTGPASGSTINDILTNSGPSATITYTVNSTTTASGLGVTAKPACAGNGITYVVTVNPLPLAPAVNDTAICNGATATLSAIPVSGESRTWYSTATGGAALASGTDVFVPSPAPNSTRSYFVNSTISVTGCATTARKQVVVTVNPIPAAPVISGTKTICSDSLTTLTSNKAVADWYDSLTAGSLIFSGQSFQTPNLNSGLDYFVSTTALGCTSATRTKVTVTTIPTPLIDPITSDQICSNALTNGFLSSAPSNNLYGWTFSNTGGTITGASNKSTPGAATAIAQSLRNSSGSPGNITYTVRAYTNNAQLCPSLPTTYSVDVNQEFAVTPTIQPVICFGLSTGSISVDASAAPQPASYQWKKGTTIFGGDNNTVTGLNAGNYDLTVTDAGGCKVLATYNVAQPAQDISISNSPITNVNCNGDATGAINISVSNTTATPVTYSWSSGDNTQNIFAKPAGPYSVTVSDGNGCLKSANYTISQPANPLSVLTSSTNDVACFGNNTGSATFNITGGTPGYTYAWTGSSSTGKTASSLVAGTYVLTVTDSKGCILNNLSATISQPAEAVAVANKVVTNVNCFGDATGEIDITPKGGTAPYTYSWTGGGTNSVKSGLSAASYSLTITDSKGCKLIEPTTITQNPVITGTLNASAYIGGFGVSCNGKNDGSIDLLPGGGVTPYTFNWSDNTTGEDASSLLAGPYSVTIKDALGCTKSFTQTITEPTVLSISTTSKKYVGGMDISCNGSSDGEINLLVSGGASATSFSTTLNGQTTAFPASGLPANVYNLLTTDANGCQATDQITLSQPAALSNTAAIASYQGGFNIQCFGLKNGSIKAVPQGGVAPYTYTWSNGETNDLNMDLGAGNYSVNIKDANGCTRTDNYILSEPAQLTIALTPQNYNGVEISCFGKSDGKINSTVSGGATPYTYTWSDNSNGVNLNNLSAGTYGLSISDANGCGQNTSITLNQPAQLSLLKTTSSYNGFEIKCKGDANGFFNCSATGGTITGGNYSYTLNGVASAPNVSGKIAGSYTMVVSDVNGCTAQDIIVLKEPTKLTATPTLSNYSGFGVSCFGGNNGSINVSSNGGVGTRKISWTGGQPANFILSGLTVGAYTYTVIDDNQCTSVRTVNITQPAALALNVVQTDAIKCFGQSTGGFDAQVNGGVTPYTYEWIDAISQVVSNLQNPKTLIAGTYNLRITDANGCIISNNGLNLTQPAVLSAVASGNNPKCFKATNGQASVLPAGGTAPYTYAWVSGPNTQQWNNTNAGKKDVVVTDKNGCKANATITLTEPALLEIKTINTQLVSCDGAASGAIYTQALGGTTPYTYSWTNSPGVSANLINLAPNTYTLTLRDANACVTSAAYTVKMVSTPDPGFTYDETACGDLQTMIYPNQTSGFDKFTYLRGTGTYTEQWNTQNLQYAFTSNGYGPLVIRREMNDQGCKSFFIDTIDFKDMPVADFNYKKDVEIDVMTNEVKFYNTSVVSNLSQPKYQWTVDGAGKSVLNSPKLALPNDEEGEHEVCLEVTNGYGCTNQSCELVLVKGKTLVYIPNTFTPDADQINDEFKIDIQGIQIDNFSISIYSRSGQLVYESKDPNFAWTGSNENGPLAVGTYVFQIKYRTADTGDYTEKSGTVTIIR